jgi:dethiobiotin synthetase
VTLVVCLGTATEIGKTWAGAAVLSELRSRGVSVAARKPVQSFDSEETGPTDADVLATATADHPDVVCPGHRWYSVAMAPPMAAAVTDRDPFTINDLLDELQWPSPEPDVRWVETVGGPRSPIAFDGDSADLCDALAPDLAVLVADAGLGTINAVRLSASALQAHRIVVLLNRFDPTDELHALNLAWLTDREAFDVATSIADLSNHEAFHPANSGEKRAP